MRQPILLATAIILSLIAAEPAPAQLCLFDQTTDTIQVAGQTTLSNAMTLEAVLYFTPQQNGFGLLFNEWTSGAEDKLLGAGPASVIGYNYPNSSPNQFIVVHAQALNVPHHVAFVVGSSQERLYVDGILVGSRAATLNTGDGAGGPFLGAIFRDGSIASSFVGYLDSLRVSNSARYTGASFSPPLGDMTSDAATLMLFNFDESPGSPTLTDISGHGHTGTLGVGFAGATSPTFVATPEPTSMALCLIASAGAALLRRRKRDYSHCCAKAQLVCTAT